MRRADGWAQRHAADPLLFRSKLLLATAQHRPALLLPRDARAEGPRIEVAEHDAVLFAAARRGACALVAAAAAAAARAEHDQEQQAGLQPAGGMNLKS